MAADGGGERSIIENEARPHPVDINNAVYLYVCLSTANLPQVLPLLRRNQLEPLRQAQL